jgi:hypothetical protein
MICENCPYGKLVQIDSLIWMVQCSIEDALMAREDECSFPDKVLKENNYAIKRKAHENNYYV